ncbi:MAG: hypothetical protein E4H07_09375 [Nitrosomonadales bacterium]|nr:MAG: hypothetical protein E4H07_09375 [Nitrosomonadales bacterium]
MALPFASYAAGLGKLTLNSYLGQPFKAEIDLVSVKKEDSLSLMASLTSRDTFHLANVDYAPFLSTFEFSVQNRVNGQPYVKITSPQPFVDPSFSMLIELNWSSGRLVREYMVLLDPPEDALQPAPPIMEVEPVVPNSVKPEPATAEQPDSIIVEDVVISDEEPIVKAVPVLVPEAVPEKETDPAKISSTTTYGPVKSGDTLIKIALKVSPPHVQLNQMLIAVHRANREAFADNNMNRLKVGSILQVPDKSEIVTISPNVADKEIKMQTDNWEAYRHKLAANTASAASASEELAQTEAGRITTATVESNTEAAGKLSEGLLKISKGEGLEGRSSSEGTISIQDKIYSMEESAIVSEKKLSQANERIEFIKEDSIANKKSLNDINQRITALEENIEGLQRLLELRNSTMASTQVRAESLLPEAIQTPPVIVEEPAKVEDRNVVSVIRDNVSLSTLGWLWWGAILLPIAGWWWKVRKASMNGTSKSPNTF